MCKLFDKIFDKIFKLSFKRWVAKEDGKEPELVVPVDSEDMKKLANEIANLCQRRKINNESK